MCCKHKKSSCSPLLDIGERRGISGKFPSENKIPRITPQVFTIEFEIVFPSQGGRRCRQTHNNRLGLLMECSLTGNQIKAFHRAVSCLAKIGNELLMEALPDKVKCTSLSLSLSLSPSLLELNDRKPGSYIDSLEFSYYGYPVLVPSRLV